jgi:hypothetical protein
VNSRPCIFPLLFFGGYLLLMVHDYINNHLAGKIRLNGSMLLCIWALMCQTNHVVHSLSPEKEKMEEEKESLP